MTEKGYAQNNGSIRQCERHVITRAYPIRCTTLFANGGNSAWFSIPQWGQFLTSTWCSYTFSSIGGMSYTCRAILFALTRLLTMLHIHCTLPPCVRQPHPLHYFIPMSNQGDLSVNLFSFGSSLLNFLSFPKPISWWWFTAVAAIFLSSPSNALLALPVSLTFLPVLRLIQSPLVLPLYTRIGFLLGWLIPSDTNGSTL